MHPYRPRGGAAAPSLANINADTIRRAEEAVGKLADQYRGWVRGDIDKLRECMEAAKYGGEARNGAYKQIRQIAHDMRGQGTTFGYPLITRIAQSISQVIKQGAPDAESDAVLSDHIDAVARVIGQDAADAGSDAAKEIISSLEALIGRPLD